MTTKIEIHNDGFVSLEKSYGDELSIVNAARVSYNKRKESLDSADIGLINYLLREQHGTPFEHSGMSFHVRCPIFVAREWFRHRIGSFSEMSGRYVEMELSAYIPEVDAVRQQVGKPGHYEFVSAEEEMAEIAIAWMKDAYLAAFHSYTEMLSMGVAKEVARNVLPLALYTEFHWTVNLRSLFNFLALRNHPAALREIQDYAKAVEAMLQLEFPTVYAAWVESGRKVP